MIDDKRLPNNVPDIYSLATLSCSRGPEFWEFVPARGIVEPSGTSPARRILGICRRSSRCTPHQEEASAVSFLLPS